MILVDGKQTALTGFGTQSALDNIPASAIDRIEIINNPSAKFDANGNAGIINIIYKKEKKKDSMANWDWLADWAPCGEKDNFPTIGAQYQGTQRSTPPSP
ncbi:hypothetical protein [Paraflavitalea speifideaquila]|uniref:hypothetical protein n=1 Tax=Paraflavitalea speifideaquila TaxID=3076558 RepID=UPI0033130626